VILVVQVYIPQDPHQGAPIVFGYTYAHANRSSGRWLSRSTLILSGNKTNKHADGSKIASSAVIIIKNCEYHQLICIVQCRVDCLGALKLPALFRELLFTSTCTLDEASQEGVRLHLLVESRRRGISSQYTATRWCTIIVNQIVIWLALVELFNTRRTCIASFPCLS
jgi:hypothetical protein